MLDTHQCAAEGCRAACPTSHLMCVPHWRMVPAALRRLVLQAFKEWRRVVRSRKLDVITARATELRKAQQQAISAVREKEVKRDLTKQENQDRLF